MTKELIDNFISFSDTLNVDGLVVIDRDILNDICTNVILNIEKCRQRAYAEMLESQIKFNDLAELKQLAEEQ